MSGHSAFAPRLYALPILFGLLLAIPPGNALAAPTVTLVGVSTGQTVSGTIQLEARVGSAASITKVEFTADATPVRTERYAPYCLGGDPGGLPCNGWDTEQLSNGSHVIKATAFDSAGGTGSASVTLNVANAGTTPTPTPTPTPSLVTLVGASEGQTVSGGLLLEARVSASGVARVEFAVDGNLVRTERVAPYCLGGDSGALPCNPWSTTGLTNGSHVFKATAHGSAGALGSAQLTLNVQNGPGPSPTPPPGTVVHRINAGGGSYTDGKGQLWKADTGFNTGQVFTTTHAISGTSDPALYQSERYDPPAAPELTYELAVASGLYTVRLHMAEIYSGAQAVGARVFDVLLEGQLAFDNLDVFKEVGGFAALIKTAQVQVNDGKLTIQFVHGVQNPKVNAIEVLTADAGAHLLHVVMDVPPYAVDYDGNGSESVTLRGSESHTHEIGRKLVGFQWSENGTVFAATADAVKSFPLGSHTVGLKITDDATPPKTLSDSKSFPVVAPGNVPGSLALYYEAGAAGPAALLDAVPAKADFAEVTPGLEVTANSGKIGGSSYTGGVMVRLLARVDIAESGQYAFQAQGGSGTRLFLQGAPVTGPVSLSPGRYGLEARFAVGSVTGLPLKVTLAKNGGAQAAVNPGLVTHDETTLVPVINTATAGGPAAGGNPVTITGLGFFPQSQVAVNWGGQKLTSLGVTPTTITFTAPPGTGTVTVTVQTPNGTSNGVPYSYQQAAPPPVDFALATLVDATKILSPTQAEWGPDGRLYVGTINGTIKAFTFDGGYNLVGTQTITALEGLPNKNILGLAFSPFDPPGAVRVFVAHANLFAHNGGTCFTGPSPYSGQVSVLTGPGFNTIETVVSGLPVSNHDHGINGLQFDNNGDLLIAVGGTTNAGVKHCNIGGLPESPLSGAILKARLSKPGFNGAVKYVNPATGAQNNDQVFGEAVDVAPGVDVSVFAPGFRNAFDLVFTTKGKVYATDNGPNAGYGPASTSATTQTSDPSADDELNLVQKGNYYGHPNRARGRHDVRQNVYRGVTLSSIAGVFAQRMTNFPASTNGITEYRAQTFQGQMRGDLIVQKWNGETYRVTPSASDTSAAKVALPDSLLSLDVVTGPGGVIIGIDYTDNKLSILRPQEAGAAGTAVYDIFPWRAHKSGGTGFVIGGTGFGGLADTSVTIGGLPAQLSSVTGTRIKGVVPAKSTPPGQLEDVVVTVAGQAHTLPKAFLYLNTPASQPNDDRWASGSPMPVALGEVAAGVIGGTLFVVGHDSPATLAYTTANGAWLPASAHPARPFPGNHHAAEVVKGKLYLLGGLGGGAEGKVQIYDPAAKSWSLGAPMPFAAGSSASAVIDGDIYVAGGIVGGSTTTSVARYDPAANSWTMLAPMPQGRNHAAAATDGKRLFVFGGRGPGSGDGNAVANGFNTVQIYDPQTNDWVSSLDPGSSLAPLPQARGGMGKAVYHAGEFYVLGGETESGAGATANKVYSRVDVYNPSTNKWRLGKPMPTARHGVFPVLYGGRVFVAGGGPQAGHSSSTALEIYVP